MVFTPEACSRFGSSDCANLPWAPRARGSDLLPHLVGQDDLQRIARPRRPSRISGISVVMRRFPRLATTVLTAGVIVAAAAALY
jgi:hypothetical protein